MVGNLNNIFHIGQKKTDSGLHIAQKPEDLMRVLIELVTVENQIVLDPFAGSGTTGVVARDLNRRFLMFEKDEKNFKTMQSRLITHQGSLI